MDPRIRVAIFALKKLEKLQKESKLKADLKEIKSKLFALQWVNDIDYLKREAEFFENFDYSRWRYGEKEEKMVEWCISILKGLRRRLERGKGNSILYGLDVDLAEVISVSDLDEKLKICRVSTKFGDLTVVTNIREIKKGDRVPLAILPPRKFGDVESEAMFLWKPVKSLSEVDWKKVEGEISNIIE